MAASEGERGESGLGPRVPPQNRDIAPGRAEREQKHARRQKASDVAPRPMAGLPNGDRLA